MPKLNLVQEIALKVVDFIYFYDVVALSAFQTTGENKAVFQQLNSLIADVIAERNLLGERAEIYKHFLLCNIEMNATFNLDRELIYEGRLSRGDKYQIVREWHEEAYELLLAQVVKAGFKRYEFDADVLNILDKSQIEKKQNYICFGLVGQALSFDFLGCIAAHVYRKFLDLNILSTGKNNIKNEYVDNEYVFLRALLFIEFEIMRNKLFHKNDQPGYMLSYHNQKVPESRIQKERKFILSLYDFYRRAIDSDFERIYQFNLLNKDEVSEYLTDMDVHFCHNIYFSANNSKWMSLFGLWHLRYNHAINEKIPLYNEDKDTNSCSNLAELELKQDFGLTIGARGLYNYHLKYKNYFDFIAMVTRELRNEPKTGFVTPCLIYGFNYNPDFSEKLLKIYDELDECTGYGK